MTKITRQTQKIFGSNAGFDQIAQFGSLQAGTPTFTTSIPTIQALSEYLTGWYGAVIGQNSPAIEDMNALCYLYAYQLAYLFQAGVAEWDAGTTYYAGSLVNNISYNFTVTSANATVGATYTNNTQTFTVLTTIAGATTLACSGTGVPLSSGTLTKASGTGDATITFSAYQLTIGIYSSIADNNTGNAVTNSSFWSQLLPNLGTAFQQVAVNSAGTGNAYTYSHVNVQSADVSQTIPSGYNLNSAYLTVPNGISYVVAGSANIGGKLQGVGTGNVQGTGTGIVRGY